MSARGPERDDPSTWETMYEGKYSAEFVAHKWIDNPDPEEDDVPFSFTEELPGVTLRTEQCDNRYADLAGRVNALAARVAQLERTIERWTADS